MRRVALRGPGSAIAIAASLLVGIACRGDHAPPASAQTEGTSSGSEGSSSGVAEPTACVPGESRACYEGPPGSEGVGACAAGQQVCTADGEGWSACAGEVWPEPRERCDTPQDDDCDGLVLCEPTLEWWLPYARWVNHVLPGEAGGVVVVGMKSDQDLDGQSDGLFVHGLDASGRLVWEHLGSPPSFQWPSAAAVDASGAIVVAGSYVGAPDFGGGGLPMAGGYGAFAVRYTAAGEHVWSHALAAEGYVAAAMDDAGNTYLAGGSIDLDAVRGPVVGDLFVVALDPAGAIAWTLVGHAGFGISEGTISLAVTEAGELALMMMNGGPDLELGGMPMGIEGYEPLLVRIGLDGDPLGFQRLSETTSVSLGRAQVLARPGGVMAVGSVWTMTETSYQAGLLMVGMDAALDPISRSNVLGQNLWLHAAAPHVDGTTVIGVQFTGLLALGTIGVGVQDDVYGAVLAALDDEGHARWAQVLYSDSYVEIPSVTVAPDGAVYFVADVHSGGVVADTAVEGMFVGKLRP